MQAEGERKEEWKRGKEEERREGIKQCRGECRKEMRMEVTRKRMNA